MWQHINVRVFTHKCTFLSFIPLQQTRLLWFRRKWGLYVVRIKRGIVWCVWRSLSLPANSLWPVHTLEPWACLGLELFWWADELDLACLTHFNIPRHGPQPLASKTEANTLNSNCFATMWWISKDYFKRQFYIRLIVAGKISHGSTLQLSAPEHGAFI